MFRIIPKSRRYIADLEKNVVVKDASDSKKLSQLHTAFNKLYSKKIVSKRTRLFFYVCLYASIISSFTSVISNYLPIFSKIMQYLLGYLGLFGATVSVIVIWLMTTSINNYDEDLVVIQSHIISIYVKNDSIEQTDVDDLLERIS